MRGLSSSRLGGRTYLKTVMAVLDTAIHVVRTDDGGLCRDVDTRLKAGHDVFMFYRDKKGN